jgi:hypothetical protein
MITLGGLQENDFTARGYLEAIGVLLVPPGEHQGC